MPDFESMHRELLAQGIPRETALAALREKGASVIDSIRCLWKVEHISVGEAKQIVLGSPVWDDHLEPHERLMDAVEEMLKLPEWQSWQ